MNPRVREAGRWVKRARLRALRNLSNEKIRYNSLLNYKEVLQKRTRLDSYPREIQVGTNWTCNLKCFYCTRETTDKARLAALPSSELEIPNPAMDRILEALPYAEIFTLTPLGEPMMFSGFTRILDLHQRMGSRNLQMTTNGNVTTDARARKIVESQVRRIYISIDSAEPAMYAEMRAGGNLAKVTEGIGRINEWKARLNSDYPELMIASTFMSRNIGHLPGLVEYAHANKIDTISVQHMDLDDPALEGETLGHHIPATLKAIREARRIGDELGVELWIHLAIKNLLSAHTEEPGVCEFLADQPAADTRGFTLMQKCVYPWTFMVVDTDGDVRPCCWAGVSFGNLAQKPFDEIWNGETAQRMRRDFLDNHIPDSCRGRHCRVDL